MAPSERARQVRRAAEGDSAEAQTQLGWLHFNGEEYTCRTRLVLARGGVKLS